MKQQNKTSLAKITDQKVQGVQEFAQWLENCGMDLTEQQIVTIAQKWQPDPRDATRKQQ